MKSISLLLMLTISTSLFSQQTNSAKNADYLKKSKNQKKVAWIMLGGGTTFVLTGMIIPHGEVVHAGFLGDDYKNDGIRSSFQSTGIIFMLASIPFFIASSKNKKKAASVSINNEKIQTLQKGSFAYKFVPAVRLTIRL